MLFNILGNFFRNTIEHIFWHIMDVQNMSPSGCQTDARTTMACQKHL